MTTPDFIIGCVVGFIIGTISVELLMYLYWKREIYPLYAFIKAKKTEEELHKLLEDGVKKGIYTKEEIIIGEKK